MTRTVVWLRTPDTFFFKYGGVLVRTFSYANVGVDFPIQFGGSRSNGVGYVRGFDFVRNERTKIGEAYANTAKRPRFLSVCKTLWNTAPATKSEEFTF